LFILLAGLSLLYTAGVSLLMSQWFGTPRIDPLAAAWGHLGSNWPEVAATMLSQPLSTLSAIGSSAGWAIVLSFGIACISKPGLTVIALVPAGLLLVASEPFKHQLWYYNSSMVWPGLAWIAGAQIFQWSISDQPRHRWLGRACAISALAAALWNVNQVPSGDHGFKLHSKLRGLSATKAIHIGEKNCPGIRSWTAGFRGNVYLPLRKPRFHLHRWPEADALLEWEHDRELAHPQPPRPVDWQSLDWSQHVKVAQVKGAAVWVRRDRVDEACTAAESDESSISEPGD
jgi:hypothetical protein